MTSDPAAQWATTALFGALTAYSLWRLVAARYLFARTGHLFHLGMNLVMVAMVWPWWARLPALPQVAYFAAGAAFFAGAAGWFALDVRVASRYRSSRCQTTNAVMMIAMVWMLAVMVRHTGGIGTAAGAAHSAHAAAPAPPDPFTLVGGAALVVALAAGGLLFLVDLVRYRREHDALGRTGTDLLAGALMSLGMAATCGLMLVG
ncbi:DUF5134 domain-containing protein [Promicromonospora kroppenstedtii]|uniref:DUF5134 domain-containing protein n=1 Tax=Promicromonospora kroppenstedtii TaxID=440482 RepID=UPI0004B60A1B|nr:DUF5134 domain-containing protein [Promicromonospora kroppenstedtii]